MTIYLYVKTHDKTGLKYLGKTTQDPFAYTGSGKYWIRHLNKHGKDHSTKIIKECQSNDEIKEWGKHYSKLWNVVESKEWANLKDEDGDGGDMSQVSAFQDYVNSGIMSETRSKNKWWNNGTHQVHAEVAPDDTYIKGRLSFANNGAYVGAEVQRGKRWVTNGEEEYMTHDELPDGFWYGRQNPKKFVRHTSAKGKKWWNNGVISKMSPEQPGAGFVPGRLPIQRKR